MSLMKLSHEINSKDVKNIAEFANSNTIDSMMGFSPIPTVVRNVEGAPDKEFRVRRMI